MYTAALNLESRVCFKCNYEAQNIDLTCPRCGKKAMWTRGTVRGLGVVMMILGVFLVGMMSAVGYGIWTIVEQTARTGATSRFNGTQEELLIIYGILGLVAIFGLGSTAAGLWQLILGKRNLYLIYLMLGLGLTFLIIGKIFTTFN